MRFSQLILTTAHADGSTIVQRNYSLSKLNLCIVEGKVLNEINVNDLGTLLSNLVGNSFHYKTYCHIFSTD